MLPEARILDLHDLLSDLSDDLLAPPVCLDQIMALRGQIRPLLLRASGVICAQANLLTVTYTLHTVTRLEHRERRWRGLRSRWVRGMSGGGGGGGGVGVPVFACRNLLSIDWAFSSFRACKRCSHNISGYSTAGTDNAPHEADGAACSPWCLLRDAGCFPATTCWHCPCDTMSGRQVVLTMWHLPLPPAVTAPLKSEVVKCRAPRHRYDRNAAACLRGIDT